VAPFQLERSQWRSPAQRWARQRDQLALLLRHAAGTCPYYSASLSNAVLALPKHCSENQLRTLSILRRANIQRNQDGIASRMLPWGRTLSGVTSGSTHEPVHYTTTELRGLFWRAIDLPGHFLPRRDLAWKLATIQAASSKNSSVRSTTDRDLRHEC